MTHNNQFNSIQILGLILSILGLVFVAFPTLIGVFAIKVITLIFLVIGFYALIFAVFVKSKLSIFVSLLTVFVGFYAFANPQYVLFLIGISCLFSGVNGIVLTFSKFKGSSERTLISSIMLMLLGVFAMINTKAALSTVVLILGIMIVILGVILFFIGTTLPKKANQFFSFSFSANTPPRKNENTSRVIVSIDDDDVEEIDFKEL